MIDSGGGVPGKTYVLITPAYNEGRFIAKTIEGVLAQTLRPSRWVIVDDGSTDNTWEIIRRYAEQAEFIEPCQRQRKAGETYYGSSVYAILQGVERVKDLPFDYLGILDADMIVGPQYYEEIFRRFEANRELGVAAGTYIEEIGGRWIEAFIDRRSTPKALQVFRRACYEQIGGYVPCPNGGEDTYTEIMARKHGWQTWSFPEIQAVHQKPVGMGDGKSLLRAKFRQGVTDYCLATHPAFMMAKCLRRCLRERPYVGAGLARLAGFAYGHIVREPRQVLDDVRRYVRKEQMTRLLASLGIGPRLWRPVQSSNGGRKGSS
jgi:glycosyltransferase involved in cell wall biosynthesis